jgi:subtilisin family serine protease
MAGIVPNISLMNIYADLDNISSYKISRGIMWAVNNGADIINCSWGAHPDVNLSFYNSLKSEQLEEALDSALYNGRNGRVVLLYLQPEMNIGQHVHILQATIRICLLLVL